jgi:hypothetical protein
VKRTFIVILVLISASSVFMRHARAQGDAIVGGYTEWRTPVMLSLEGNVGFHDAAPSYSYGLSALWYWRAAINFHGWDLVRIGFSDLSYSWLNASGATTSAITVAPALEYSKFWAPWEIDVGVPVQLQFTRGRTSTLTAAPYIEPKIAKVLYNGNDVPIVKVGIGVRAQYVIGNDLLRFSRMVPAKTLYVTFGIYVSYFVDPPWSNI